MARPVALALGSAAILVVATTSVASPRVQTYIGPVQVVSPSFAFVNAVAQRGGRASPGSGLYVWNGHRWRWRSRMSADFFLDPSHGWTTTWDCATNRVVLHRTSDGGRHWRSLGQVDAHNCSAGSDSHVTFADARHGWILTVEPNGPTTRLSGTADGGRDWSVLKSGEEGTMCEGQPIFASIRDGFIGHSYFAISGTCFAVTHDGGRHWRRQRLAIPRAWKRAVVAVDLPRFFGKIGVVAVTVRRAGHAAVLFYSTGDAGHAWRLRAVRRIQPCPDRDIFTGAYAITSIAGPGIWWIVSSPSGRVDVTRNGGRRWASSNSSLAGFPRCNTSSLAAADSRTAWVTEKTRGAEHSLLETRDGGRTWRRISPL